MQARRQWDMWRNGSSKGAVPCSCLTGQTGFLALSQCYLHLESKAEQWIATELCEQ